ncbi:MAG: stage II sporulation protein M [archaeon]
MKLNKKSFSKIYSDCWKYIKSCKIQIYSVISLFFLFAFIGFFVPVPGELMNQILDYIRKILEQTKGMSTFQLISFIFFNNLQASLMSLLFGFFLGIFPILFTILNGYILGFVASLAVGQEGFLSLLSLFPHGVFELPAVFISLGIGLRLGAFIFQKNKKEFFKKNMPNAMKVFLFMVVPLLLVAAIIEGILIFLIK